MRGPRLRAVPALALMVALTACGPVATPSGRGAAASAPATPRRITVTMMDDPVVMSSKLSAPSVRGSDALEELVNVGLATLDHSGSLIPMLGEAVPSLENGLWTLLSDGGMQTTYRIRDGARWHDGQPLTSADLVFTAAVAHDREVPELRDPAFDSVASVDAPDARTVVVRWSKPYVDADALFTRAGATRARTLPLPAHILQESYGDDKGSLTQLPYWSTEFVGTGPFKLASWEPGTSITLQASDVYVLGRPKIDEIEVRFIPDPNALVANVLAGSIDFTLGRGLSLEQAILMRDQWKDGRMVASPSNWIMVWPQFINPSPSIVGDVRFRRAMLEAIDRQAMVDTFVAGMSSVAHTYLSPTDPNYQTVAADVVRYPFDPQAAAQAIEARGYSPGTDSMLRDAANQPLRVEIRTTTGDTLRERIHLAIADAWQRVGVGVDTVVVSRQQAQDQEYRAQFPAFELSRNPNTLRDLPNLHSRAARLPENNFHGTGGTNYSRYTSPVFDTLIDQYFVTIPLPERLAVAHQIVSIIADQVTALGILYATDQNMIANRIQKAYGRAEGSTETWNAYQWEIAAP
ncbi:MAG TPA: ABC transporter substrate-binding protein [Chloroflexota bacterium]|nr:ABC transporter substrate-binding protein [Chloroflexota bacterium]